MGTLRDWVRRRRVLAAFAAGVLLTLAAVAIVGYLVLADQRRSARILAAALTQALARGVEIDRVTDLGPSRVVLRGLRLPAERGWPAEVKAESVEASGPLLSAARGEAAPVRLLVTRPKIVAGGGGATGAAALEGLRQGLASFIGSAPLVDVAITGGVIQAPGSSSEDVTFDATLHKGSGEVRGEVLLRDRARSRFTLGLHARADGDTIRLDLAGEGGLAPLAPWLPAALVAAARTAPVDLRAQLGLSPGDRAAGRASARLGDLAALEGALSFQDGRLRLGELRGTADLGLAGSMAGLAGPVKGHAELADGEVTWAPERGGWPEARVTLHVLDATLPASAVGLDVLARGVEARLALGPREDGVSARGDLRGERVEIAGLVLAPVATPLRVDLDAGGSLSRVELTGLTAQVHGVPLRGTVAYDVARARADARVETSAVRLDALARHFGGDWLGPSDQLRAGSVRVVVTGLDPRGWTDGKVDAEIRGVALRQPAGEAAVDRARVQATVRSGSATVEYEAERVRGALPSFEGLLHRVAGSADVRRDAAGVRLARATIVARDAEGREMLQADLGRPSDRLHRADPADRAPARPRASRAALAVGPAGGHRVGDGRARVAGHGIRRVRRAPGPSGRHGGAPRRAPEPPRRLGRRAGASGGAVPPAGAAADGPFKVGELVGYGVVLYDVTARARAVDQRLTLTDLHYGLYSGVGQGTIELELSAAGPTARARIMGERVRIDEFMAAYGIHGGTMTGLLRYDLDVRYGGGRFGADGRLGVPGGGTVTIELLDRLLSWAEADPTGVVRTALGNLRAFDYKAADVVVRTEPDEDVKVTVSLKGREILGIFPPRVKEINVISMPIGFLAKQFPGL